MTVDEEITGACARSREKDMKPTMVTIFWSQDDQAYVATDGMRPGCCAVGDTEADALYELDDARKAWDEARRDWKRSLTEPAFKSPE